MLRSARACQRYKAVGSCADSFACGEVPVVVEIDVLPLLMPADALVLEAEAVLPEAWGCREEHGSSLLLSPLLPILVLQF